MILTYPVTTGGNHLAGTYVTKHLFSSLILCMVLDLNKHIIIIIIMHIKYKILSEISFLL